MSKRTELDWEQERCLFISSTVRNMLHGSVSFSAFTVGKQVDMMGSEIIAPQVARQVYMAAEALWVEERRNLERLQKTIDAMMEALPEEPKPSGFTATGKSVFPGEKLVPGMRYQINRVYFFESPPRLVNVDAIAAGEGDDFYLDTHYTTSLGHRGGMEYIGWRVMWLGNVIGVATALERA